MSYQVINPFVQFVDPANGKPLSAGTVYFGRMDTDPKAQPANRLNVYIVQDNGTESPITQPITLNGAGQPQYSGSVKQIKVELYAGESAYCVQVFSKSGAQKGYSSRVSALIDSVSLASSSSTILIGGVEVRLLASRYENLVSIEDYKKKGLSDTQAFKQALLDGTLIYAPKQYTITEKLTPQANTTIYGKNQGHSSITKGFNGDLFDGVTGLQFNNISLLGAGSLFTGRGIVYSASSPLSRIVDCKIADFQGYCVEMSAPNAGSQFEMARCEIYRTTPSNPAIKLPTDSVSSPRVFAHCNTSGGNLIDCGGAENVQIIGGNVNQITVSSGKKVQLTGVRIATVGAPFTLSGTDNIMTGCAIAGDLVVAGTSNSISATGNIITGDVTVNAGAQRINVTSNQVLGTVVDNSGVAGNKIDIYKKSYAPTFSTTGTPPTLGDATLIGQYYRNNDSVTVQIEFIVGTTTTLGTGDFTFTLPFTSTGSQRAVCTAMATRSGVGYFVCAAVVAAGSNTVKVYADGASSAVSSSSPFAWTTNDNLIIQVTYTV